MSSYLLDDTSYSTLHAALMNVEQQRSKSSLEYEFYEAQSAIDFYPNHPLCSSHFSHSISNIEFSIIVREREERG